ncbi:hypothetical protein ACLKA6_009413 [Drosophila palustris]
MAGVIGLDNELELELELELANEHQEALAISCWSSVLRLCLHNSGNIKRRHRKTLQPLQGHEELAILRRHLSKVARNYDYVRAQTANGVQQEVVEGRGVQLG